MVQELIEAVLGDPALGLTKEQRREVGPAIRRNLVALPGGA